jgi:hypothetical protein
MYAWFCESANISHGMHLPSVSHVARRTSQVTTAMAMDAADVIMARLDQQGEAERRI